MSKKRVSIFLFIAVILFCLIALLVYYILFSTEGSQFITKVVLSRYVVSREIVIKKIEGVLSQQLSFHEISIKDLEKLPLGSTIKIQRLDVSIPSLNFKKVKVKIYNGRLKMPWSLKG